MTEAISHVIYYIASLCSELSIGRGHADGSSLVPRLHARIYTMDYHWEKPKFRKYTGQCKFPVAFPEPVLEFRAFFRTSEGKTINREFAL